MTTFFEYAKCSTCRKAKAFLTKSAVPFTPRPIVDAPPTVAELKDLIARSGKPIAKFFNTSGESYRAIGKDAVAAATEAKKLSMLAADGKLIKRPILDLGTKVLVGFDEAEWKAAVRR